MTPIRQYLATGLTVLSATAALLLASCSGSKNADPQAQALLDGANQAFTAADYTLATSLLDSLQKTFPGEIALQKEAMALRPKVIEKATLLQISTNDRMGVMNDVLQTLTNNHINVKDFNGKTLSEGYGIINIVIEVTGLSQLDALKKKLRSLRGVINVVRQSM